MGPTKRILQSIEREPTNRTGEEIYKTEDCRWWRTLEPWEEDWTQTGARGINTNGTINET